MGAAFEGLSFDTERLQVGEWHDAVKRTGRGLSSAIAELMTPATTESLPESWRGDYSVERAQRWIVERDAESPTLLVTDRRTGEAIGLLIVFLDMSSGKATSDVRIGYLLNEAVWGQGFASELVAGVVTWAKAHPDIATLTAGVEGSNMASARVLLKNGFMQLEPESEAGFTYRLNLGRTP